MDGCRRRRHHLNCPQFIGTQCVAFVIHVAGAATLMDYSTLNSSIQPIIRDSMKRLIMSSSLPESSTVLKMIQENVSIIEMQQIPLSHPTKKKTRPTKMAQAKIQ